MITHKELEAYKQSIELVTELYRLTAVFPKEEMFGLVAQIRRSAISIPSNIAEGAARQYKKEYVQFLYVSLGSASELDTQLLIAQNLAYIAPETYASFSEKIITISKLIQGLIKKNKASYT